MKLNAGQQLAVDAITSGKNVFITGEGGTGKSVVVNHAIEYLERRGCQVVVCAPTGIAAQVIHGATVNSAFRFGCEPKVASALEACAPSKVIHAADVVIIDEIGMVRRDTMDAIARVVDLENAVRRSEERKPLQIVVVGDFFQLPPVVVDGDRKVLIEEYGEETAASGFYAFEAAGWDRMGFTPFVLTEPMRQSDPALVANLNAARVGDRGCLDYFNALQRSDAAPEGTISIVSRNRDADQINKVHMDALSGRSEVFEGSVTGEFDKKDMSAPLKLNLKIGARVMILVNDRDRGYINGNTGYVKELHASAGDGLPCISVELDDGSVVSVVKATWEKVVYDVEKPEKPGGKKRLKQVVVGSYSQYPLKPAWAITYHKSQGQTFERAILNPSTFGAGMLYVGLSRVKSSSGLYITRDIEPRSLVADEDVVAFYRSLDPSTAIDVDPAAEFDEPDDSSFSAPDATTNNDAELSEMTIDAVSTELHKLLCNGPRSWVRVYELVALVYEEGLFKPGFKNFSAWVKHEAKREGVSESLLWHRKAAGDFYRKWASSNPEAPDLASCKTVSETNLDLVKKIHGVDQGRGDDLMRALISDGLSTAALRDEWKSLRGKKNVAPRRFDLKVEQDALRIVVDFDDRDAFDRVLKALNRM